MPLRLTALPPDRAAQSQLLDGDGPWLLGRDGGCEVVLDHPSVSRRHAELSRDADGYLLRDLSSKNGMHVNGLRVGTLAVREPSWCLLGDVFCELEPLDAAAADAARRREHARRETARALTGALEPAAGERTLLAQVVDAVVELAEAERGFVLLRTDDGALHVVAASGAGLESAAAPSFGGSRGALARAVDAADPVISHDTAGDTWLGARASVVAGGLSALLAVPLLEDGRVVGAVYADSSRPGKRFTTLDLELLQAFCGRAALMLAALDLRSRLQRAGGAAVPGTLPLQAPTAS